MQKKINNHQKNLKNFLNAKEINHLMNEVFSKMLKYSDKKSIIYKNKKIDFLLNRSKFDKEYNKIKKNKNWNKFYESLKNLKSYRKIIIPKSKKYFQKIFGKKCKIVNSQIRVIEKNDKRNYPIHQEIIKDKKNLLTFWIAMHKIKKKEGGLLISKSIPNKKITHYKNNMGYTYLPNQSKWKKKCFEKSFQAGEACVLGQNIPHGTASKSINNPRWAVIIRTTF